METNRPGREPQLEVLARHTVHRSRPDQYRRGGRSRTAERDLVSILRNYLSHSQGRR